MNKEAIKATLFKYKGENHEIDLKKGFFKIGSHKKTQIIFKLFIVVFKLIFFASIPGPHGPIEGLI